MHGRVKTRTTEEQKEIARQEKCKKAKIYRETMTVILEKRSSSNCEKDVLNLTASLLTSNPDIITLWNYRREIFLTFKNREDPETYQTLLEKDLSLTEQCLRVNPKSYGSWHHRIWILENLPRPDWEKELKLCTKYLQLDERNFHCWDYRRIVTQKSNVSDESEYKYTLEKIESNFSNYSAWHLRSKLLPKIFPDPEGRFPIDEAKHKEELELVESAAFTDPNDQSAWFYLRWLLNLTEPKTCFVFVKAEEEEIFIVMSKSLKLGGKSKFGISVEVKINGKAVDGDWKSERVPSCMWTFKFDSKIGTSDSVEVELKENGMEQRKVQISVNSSFTGEPNFYPTFSENLRKTLTNQFSSCEQLLELEPDSKWTLLTSIFLMLSIDCSLHEPLIMQTLDKLSLIDQLRTGYYLDLRTKILTHLAIIRNFNKTKKIHLSSQSLTLLYHSQYFFLFEEIDLSNNHLNSESLTQFYTFIKCKILNLSGNNIENVNRLSPLPNLEALILDNNCIEDIDPKWVSRFPKLKSLSVLRNPIVIKKDFMDQLASQFSYIKINSSS